MQNQNVYTCITVHVKAKYYTKISKIQFHFLKPFSIKTAHVMALIDVEDNVQTMHLKQQWSINNICRQKDMQSSILQYIITEQYIF